MKKILCILCTWVVLSTSAQSSLLLINSANGFTYAPDAVIYPTTTANTNTKIVIDIKNISASTKTYKLVRNDVSLNAGASAYFCFAGGCYSELTTTSPFNLTLTAGQSASQVQGSYNMLTADLDEGPNVGESIVEYSFVNVADGKDVTRLTIKYNYTGAVGIEEGTQNAALFGIYPNPARETLSIQLNNRDQGGSFLAIHNVTGQELFQKTVLAGAGETELDVCIGHLLPGLYFVTVTSGKMSATKKMIVQK